MPKPEIEFGTVMPYVTTTTPSLITQILSSDPGTGDQTVLLTHAPAREWGDPVCQHDYWEEAYIIEGRLYDKTLRQWFPAGSYCCRPPGMLHGPYLADGTTGVKEICYLRYARKEDRL